MEGGRLKMQKEETGHPHSARTGWGDIWSTVEPRGAQHWAYVQTRSPPPKVLFPVDTWWQSGSQFSPSERPWWHINHTTACRGICSWPTQNKFHSLEFCLGYFFFLIGFLFFVLGVWRMLHLFFNFEFSWVFCLFFWRETIKVWG